MRVEDLFHNVLFVYEDIVILKVIMSTRESSLTYMCMTNSYILTRITGPTNSKSIRIVVLFCLLEKLRSFGTAELAVISNTHICCLIYLFPITPDVSTHHVMSLFSITLNSLNTLVAFKFAFKTCGHGRFLKEVSRCGNDDGGYKLGF